MKLGEELTVYFNNLWKDVMGLKRGVRWPEADAAKGIKKWTRCPGGSLATWWDRARDRLEGKMMVLFTTRRKLGEKQLY